jgi:hypothetical protein
VVLTGSLSQFGGAQSYCTNLVEGGFSDWRTPTLAEALTMSADGGWGPNEYPIHVRLGSAGIWTSEKRGNKAWGVNVYSGTAIVQLKASLLEVTCIRP